MTNAMQKRMFDGNVSSVRYLHSGGWSGVDSILKATKSMLAFTGKAININMENGLQLYVNHGMNPIAVTGGDNVYTINRDGFAAFNQADGFIAFTAALNSPTLGSTSGNVISYVYAPNEYELFHGRSTTVTGLGNIVTSGLNRSQLKVHNYIRNMTLIASSSNGQQFIPLTVYTGLV
jgi:hypothetical protein